MMCGKVFFESYYQLVIYIRTCACRCSVFLLDSHGQELVATVFDGAVQAKVSITNLCKSNYACTYICLNIICTHKNYSQSAVRIAVGQGIAGFVAKTGTIL